MHKALRFQTSECTRPSDFQGTQASSFKAKALAFAFRPVCKASVLSMCMLNFPSPPMPAIRSRGVSCQVRKTILTPMFGALGGSLGIFGGPRVANTKILEKKVTILEREQAKEEHRTQLQGETTVSSVMKYIIIESYTTGLSTNAQRMFAEFAGEDPDRRHIYLCCSRYHCHRVSYNLEHNVIIFTLFRSSTWTGRKSIRHRTWTACRNAEFASWDSIMGPLVNSYLAWRYEASNPQSPQLNHLEVDAVPYTIMVYDLNISSNTRITTHTLVRPPDSISPALDFIRHSFLVKTPTLPQVAISLKTLELYHRFRLQKPLYSAEAFAKVIFDFYLVSTTVFSTFVTESH